MKKRIIATVLDYLLIGLFSIAYIVLFGEENLDGSRSVRGWMALPIPIVWFAYFILWEFFYGATIAHDGFRLKVLSLDGEKVRFSQSLKRHLLDPIDILLYGLPAIIAIKNSDRHQRLGDIWAGTVIVDTSDEEQLRMKSASNDMGSIADLLYKAE